MRPSALSEVDQFVGKLGTEDKLYFLGEKTIRGWAASAATTIPGFENAKPIGTPLNDWGLKSPTRLDYGHIREYLEDQNAGRTRRRSRTAPTPSIQEKLEHESRSASCSRSCTGPAATTT